MAGALEIAAASLEDSLIGSMNFHGRSTASYIISRCSTAYVPQSGDTFSWSPGKPRSELGAPPVTFFGLRGQRLDVRKPHGISTVTVYIYPDENVFLSVAICGRAFAGV